MEIYCWGCICCCGVGYYYVFGDCNIGGCCIGCCLLLGKIRFIMWGCNVSSEGDNFYVITEVNYVLFSFSPYL